MNPFGPLGCSECLKKDALINELTLRIADLVAERDQALRVANENLASVSDVAQPLLPKGTPRQLAVAYPPLRVNSGGGYFRVIVYLGVIDGRKLEKKFRAQTIEDVTQKANEFVERYNTHEEGSVPFYNSPPPPLVKRRVKLASVMFDKVRKQFEMRIYHGVNAIGRPARKHISAKTKEELLIRANAFVDEWNAGIPDA